MEFIKLNGNTDVFIKNMRLAYVKTNIVSSLEYVSVKVLRGIMEKNRKKCLMKT